MPALEPVLKVLRYRGRPDLAVLLANSSCDFDESTQYGSYLYSTLTTVEIRSSLREHDRLKALNEADTKAILDAFLEVHPPQAHSIELCGVRFILDASTLEDEDDTADIVREIEAQRELMIDVATGGARIPDVDEKYRARQSHIRKRLGPLGFRDPNEFESLWDWYKKWRADIAGYQPRREFVSAMYAPLLAQLRGESAPPARAFEQPTGWPAVDSGIAEVRRLLNGANTERLFQGVGHCCRELTITVAQTVFDKERHPILDGTTASTTDAKRMLEAFIAVEFAGQSKEDLRKYARSAFDLANNLQHRRTATFRDAAICAEATISLANLLSIVAGRRDAPV
jgi:hypothetical protein